LRIRGINSILSYMLTASAVIFASIMNEISEQNLRRSNLFTCSKDYICSWL